MILFPYFDYADRIIDYYVDNVLSADFREHEMRKRLKSSVFNSRWPAQIKYQDWLFTQGARIIRKDKKSYLEFTSEESAIMFMLSKV